MEVRGRSSIMRQTKENEILLHLLFSPEKVRSLLNVSPSGRNVDWDTIAATGKRESVAGIMYNNIKTHKLSDLIPESTYRDLSSFYFTTLRRNMAIIAELRTVMSRLAEHTIIPIVLKGIALLEHSYVSVGMRGMSDVDLLFRKEQLFRVDDVLSSMGYFPIDGTVSMRIHNPNGYLASLEYHGTSNSSLIIHVHWHLVNTSVPATSYVEFIDMESIWEKSLETSIADRNARILCPEHQLIYLCEHALRVGHSFDRLILLSDIFFFLKKFAANIDWDFFVKETARFRLRTFVYFALLIVSNFTSAQIPTRVLHHLKPPRITWMEKIFLTCQLQNRRIRGSSYLLHLTSNNNFIEKCRFVMRTFFPPADILSQRKKTIHSQHRRVYYLSRIWEIISHSFRIISDLRASH